MRKASDAADEFWLLTSDEGRALLGTVAESNSLGPADLVRWRKLASPEKVAAAVRLVEARRRGASKFVKSSEMWLEATGLEQSTAEAVARHKARRFPSGIVFDLCCGIGGDMIALAEASTVIAVDASHQMTRRARWNAAVYGVGERVLAVRGRAEEIVRSTGSWVHVDPDRRARSAKRARDLVGYAPGLEFLRDLQRTAPGGAIKLGPASDFADHFGGDGVEVELMSLGGECKEATVWFGAAATCRRRATRLPEGGTWTDQDGSSSPRTRIGEVGRYVFDPDPSLLRAGLLDGFGEALGLHRFLPGNDYLTGEVLPASPFLSPFEVIAVLAFDDKRLRREVRALALDVQEVKTRGVRTSPEEIRNRLRNPDGTPTTLLIAGGRGPTIAILARRPA